MSNFIKIDRDRSSSVIRKDSIREIRTYIYESSVGGNVYGICIELLNGVPDIRIDFDALEERDSYFNKLAGELTERKD